MAKRKSRRSIAVIAVAQFTLSLLLPFSASAFTENSYRWRNDNGSEANATNAAAENAALSTASIGVNQRLRFGVTNSGTETELLRQAGMALQIGDDRIRATVLDTAAGFAYLGTNTRPARVVKVRLSDMTKVASLDFALGEDLILGAVIDTLRGFAYFCLQTSPGKIVKIRLSDFTIVSTLTLASGENIPRAASIDIAAGFAYFGTNSTPGRVAKIDLSTFTEVGTALILGAGENGLFSSLIDTAAGYVYFTTFTSPSRVVKIRLSDMTPVGSVTLNSGENITQSGVIDTAAGFAYIGTSTSPGIVVKVALGVGAAPPTRVGAITFSTGENSLTAATIDPVGGFAYFGTSTDPGNIVKVRLSDFTRDGVMTFSAANERSFFSAAIDTTSGFAYFMSLSSAAIMTKIRLSDFTKISSTYLDGGEGFPDSILVDSAGGFAYVSTFTSPGKIVKIRLSDFTKVATLTFDNGEYSGQHAAFLDLAGGFAYFGTVTFPAKVMKVRLSDFTRVATLTLSSGNDNLGAAAFDPSGFAYFGTRTTPGRIVKIRLSDFTEVATLTLGAGEDQINAAVIDTVAGFAYFGTFTSPGKVVKIRLSDFVELPTLTFASGENSIRSGVIDVPGGFAYFGLDSFSGKIIKVSLSTFTETAALTLSSSEGLFSHADIDLANGFAYFVTTAGSTVSVSKIRLSDFTGVATLAPTGDETVPTAIGIDVPRGIAYVGAGQASGRLVKASIAPKSQFRLEYGLKTSTCAAIGSWTQVPSVAGPTDAWQMADSGFFIDDAAASNNAGLTDGNTSFNPGVVKDTSSQTGNVSLGEKQFTEVEYSVKAVNDSTIGSNYCFRLTNAGSTTGFVYTQYAEATVTPRPPSGSGGCSFVIRPNGGEHMTAGQSYEIQWSHSSCQSQAARISLSTDGGGTYPTIIAANEPEDGTYTWTVPDINTTSAKVRVELLMGGTVQSSDASDGDFSITGTPGAPSTPPPTTTTPYDPTAEQAKATSIDQDQGWAASTEPLPCTPGTALKSVSSKAVYYCGTDGKKHVFPNEKTFKTWFADFSHVMTFSDATVAAIPEGKTITYKPGVKMVKLPTDAKTYAVSAGGVLRWVTSEATAEQLYGADWNRKIDDLSQSIFDTYTMGELVN